MAVYALAWPIGMNAILQQAILLIDTILVGGLGEEALAAMGIATSIAGLILGVSRQIVITHIPQRTALVVYERQLPPTRATATLALPGVTAFPIAISTDHLIPRDQIGSTYSRIRIQRQLSLLE